MLRTITTCAHSWSCFFFGKGSKMWIVLIRINNKRCEFRIWIIVFLVGTWIFAFCVLFSFSFFMIPKWHVAFYYSSYCLSGFVFQLSQTWEIQTLQIWACGFYVGNILRSVCKRESIAVDVKPNTYLMCCKNSHLLYFTNIITNSMFVRSSTLSR